MSRHAGVWAPVTAARARATRVDRRANEGRVVRGPADGGQMGRHSLVEADKFVHLRPGKAPAAADEMLEPPPLGGVRQHVRVDVHEGTLCPGVDVTRQETVGASRRGRRIRGRVVKLALSLAAAVVPRDLRAH